MSILTEFLEKRSKSFKYWLLLLWSNLQIKEEEIDDSWKEIKIKQSFYPGLYPKKNPDNVFAYLEINNQYKSWKRV